MRLFLYRKVAVFIAAGCVLVGCSGQASVKNTDVSAGIQIESEDENIYNTHDNASGKATEKPELEEDYYTYINYDILRENSIPATEAEWTYFYELNREAEENIEEIITEVVDNREQYEKGSTEQKIADLYLCSLDMEERNKKGLEPIQPILDLIERASTIQEYVDALGAIYGEYGYNSLISAYIDSDMKNSEKYAIYFGAPDMVRGKEFFENDSFKTNWEVYKGYITKVFELLGYNNIKAAQAASEIFELQKDLASSCMPNEDTYNPANVYNAYTKEDFKELYSNINTDSLLEKMKISHAEKYIVMEIEAAKKVNSYLIESKLDLLKNYTIFILINDFADTLSGHFRDAKIEMNNTLEGIKQQKTDERLAVSIVQKLADIELGKLYVQRFFDEKSKAEIKSMVDEIMRVYENRIDRLSWMSAQTKQNAKKKLKTMTIKIGYPDVWPTYFDKVEIVSKEEGGSLLAGRLAFIKAQQEYNLSRIGSPVDKNEWSMLPQTINAYYNPSANEIVFPAGILQKPFYDKEADYSTNLGGIGMVIAHEISHAFDTNGALYDEKGNYNIWWSDEDYKAFTALTEKVKQYYYGFEAVDGNYVNGALTLSENIADLGAVFCIVEIAENHAKPLDSLFSSYAKIWAKKSTKEYEMLLLNQDTHAPAKVRVNAILGSCEAFYNTYNITENDAMYIEPEERIKIW